MHLYIHYSITKIAKICKQPKYPSRNKWIKDTSCANHSVFGHWELFQLAYLSFWYISIKAHAIFSSISFFSGILLLPAHLVYFMPHCHNQLLFFLEKFWFLYYRMLLETRPKYWDVLIFTEISFLLGFLRTKARKWVCAS